MNPSCNKELFQFFESGVIGNFEELAHLIAESERGPRGQAPLTAAQRDEFDNILVLCPSCHTLIDKNPSEYPVELLRRWKGEHEKRVVDCFVVPSFAERAQLREKVKRLLRENRAVFDTYGPYAVENQNPLDERARTWARLVKERVIPNNRKLLHLLLKNSGLLTDSELQTLEAFRLHAGGLEFNHLSGDKTSDAPLFPRAMNEILDA